MLPRGTVIGLVINTGGLCAAMGMMIGDTGS